MRGYMGSGRLRSVDATRRLRVKGRRNSDPINEKALDKQGTAHAPIIAMLSFCLANVFPILETLPCDAGCFSVLLSAISNRFANLL